MFTVVAFEPGTEFSPETWYTIRPVAIVAQPEAGAFTLGGLPPGTNYDLHLVVIDETDGEIESGTILDSVLDVPTGATGVSLNYSTQGETVGGRVRNVRQEPLLGAQILLADPVSGDFAGFADAGANGEYVFYNIPAGTYTVIAIHGKYLNAATMIQVIDGQTAQADTIILPFLGEKEGADLNGDGIVDSNFDRQGNVDLADFSKVADNWYRQAIWKTGTERFNLVGHWTDGR